MNISEVHDNTKEVSAKAVFKGEQGQVMAIQLQENGHLKEHLTKTPALLVCISGEVVYEDEQEQRVILKAGDMYEIPAMVKHWLRADSKSQLMLMK